MSELDDIRVSTIAALRDTIEAKDAMIGDLRAEVERLRLERECAAQQVEFLCADVSRLRAAYDAERGNSVSLASELAAANALLERIDRIQPKALGGDIRAHLAKQGT